MLSENAPRKAIAAIDFFTVPTLTFGVLYCFFVIAHDRLEVDQVRGGLSPRLRNGSRGQEFHREVPGVL
jgi:hypothetical protein